MSNKPFEEAWEAINAYEEGTGSYIDAKVAVDNLDPYCEEEEADDERNYLSELLEDIVSAKNSGKSLDEIEDMVERDVRKHGDHYRTRYKESKRKKARKEKNATNARAEARKKERFSAPWRKNK